MNYLFSAFLQNYDDGISGIGGSDWIAVQIIMHIVTKLVTSYDDEKLMGFDWWIIPVLNPDGYINSMVNKISNKMIID